MTITVDEVRYLQSATDNDAKSLRRNLNDVQGVGVNGRDDFNVTFNSGLTVNVAAGTGYVRGLSSAGQGMYRARLNTGGSVTLAANGSANARLDQICLIVRDSGEDAGSHNDCIIDVIAGSTASSGATLDNRTGAADLTAQSSPTIIRLADVLVNPGNSPALSSAGIRDRRPHALQGTVPPLISDFDIVQFLPTPGVNWGSHKIDINSTAAYGGQQSACLMYLPRRIAATRIRWAYQQDHTNQAGTGQAYRFAICDASGRLVCNTSAVNFRNATADATAYEILTLSMNTPEFPSSGYVFEAGLYYVWFGVTAAGSSEIFYSVCADCDANNPGHLPMTVNQFVRLGSGGTTFPATNTILGMTDMTTFASPTGAFLPVPVISLSVG